MRGKDVPVCFKNHRALEYVEDEEYHDYYVLDIIIRHLFEECSRFEQIPSSYIEKFNLQNVSFPLSFDGLKTLVEANPQLPITINVLCHDETVISNLGIISNEKKAVRVLHLLMFVQKNSTNVVDSVFLSEDEESDSQFDQSHFFYKILDVRKLLNFRRWKLNLNKKNNNPQKNFYCEKCFLRFRSKHKKNRHSNVCENGQEVEYPRENDKLRFFHRENLDKLSVIGFCDFESVLQRLGERRHCEQCDKEECECNISVTQDINAHRPVGYSILFVDHLEEVFYQEEYAGTDCVKHFYDRLPAYEKIVHNRRQAFQKKIKASLEEWKAYEEAETCHVCQLPFGNTKNEKKVLDHDHVTGKIVGAAHSICNLNRQPPYKTPIFFHNAQGYVFFIY